jgi:hypothetical protein
MPSRKRKSAGPGRKPASKKRKTTKTTAGAPADDAGS